MNTKEELKNGTITYHLTTCLRVEILRFGVPFGYLEINNISTALSPVHQRTQGGDLDVLDADQIHEIIHRFIENKRFAIVPSSPKGTEDDLL